MSDLVDIPIKQFTIGILKLSEKKILIPVLVSERSDT